MKNLNTSVAVVAHTFVAGLLTLAVPCLSLADDRVHDELQSCAALEDASQRLVCYDKLSGRQALLPPESQLPAMPVPGTLGAESLSRSDDDEDEAPAVVARVLMCKKNLRKKYVFHLEGGQIWKQISDRRLYWKECDFNVTISKDFFGYKMQLEGEKTKFRVSRIR